MYTDIEQQILDIDWFFTDGKKIAFVASAGGKLPNSIAGLGDENSLLSSYFRNLPEISDVIINPQLEEILQNIDTAYLSDFVYMSRKGFYSFDKTRLNDFLDTHYHLVAKPSNPLNLSSLPKEILETLLKTRYCNELENNIQGLDISTDFTAGLPAPSHE